MTMTAVCPDSWIFKQLTDNGFRSSAKETNIITLKSSHVAKANKSARGDAIVRIKI